MAELITTGAAARILGTSRQHVVNLTERGVLRRYGGGVHRRIDRAEAEALAGRRLGRDARRSLWLHHAVAGRLVQDPEGVLLRARANLARMHEVHGQRQPWLERWQRILAGGPDEVLRILTAETPEAIELRQNSPFAGVLSVRERQLVLDAFRATDASREPA